MGRPRTDPAVRLWSKVKVGSPEECWPWTARCTDRRGYGLIRNGESVMVLAHRLAYELEIGSILSGLVVRHKCDNPPCCNPNHLELGTASDNQRDSVSRGRQVHVRKTHCPNGHEYNEENTYRHGNSRGCRSCRTAQAAACHRKKRQKVSAHCEYAV